MASPIFDAALSSSRITNTNLSWPPLLCFFRLCCSGSVRRSWCQNQSSYATTLPYIIWTGEGRKKKKKAVELQASHYDNAAVMFRESCLILHVNSVQPILQHHARSFPSIHIQRVNGAQRDAGRQRSALTIKREKCESRGTACTHTHKQHFIYITVFQSGRACPALWSFTGFKKTKNSSLILEDVFGGRDQGCWTVVGGIAISLVM